ncbi:MAG: SRPBCC family protein [Planctomycetes bacterium]|nr:SRPBCC family protein [Planctomycetota bacterium]
MNLRFKHIVLAALVSQIIFAIVVVLGVYAVGATALKPSEERDEKLEQAADETWDELFEELAANPPTSAPEAPVARSALTNEISSPAEFDAEEASAAIASAEEDASQIEAHPEVVPERIANADLRDAATRDQMLPFLEQGSFAQVLQTESEGPGYPVRVSTLVEAPLRLVFALFRRIDQWSGFVPKVEGSKVVEGGDADLRTELVYNMTYMPRRTVVEDWTIIENESMHSEIVRGEVTGWNRYDFYEATAERTIVVHTTYTVVTNALARMITGAESSWDTQFNLAGAILRMDAFKQRGEAMYKRFLEQREDGNE